MTAERNDFDVAVIGGAFSGASAALLLKRRLPGARVLIVERSSRFDRKVGEATVEVSAFFLHRVLGLYDHLSREHLPKHGLRYWIASGTESALEEMVELGATGPPSLPTFQLDRSVLDEHLLSLAAAAGAEVIRPGRVEEVGLGWPRSRLRLRTEYGDGERELTARWVIDASGRQALLARKLGIHERTERLPTAALWARFRGVADLDGPEVLGCDPEAPRLPPLLASRRLATNHFCGYGWWCWAIALAGGETSVGVVYHKDLFSLPEGPTQRGRFEAFVRSRPGLSELLVEAEIDGDDFKALRHLPYRATRYADPGWALVGDAAAFLDPFYSPGLDHASISVWATTELVRKELEGELAGGDLGVELEAHNASFVRSYDRWLEALYLGKYELMGDAELLAASFFVDTGLYYQGVVAPLYRKLENLGLPLFGAPLRQVDLAHRFLRFFLRRLVRIARFRRRVGIYGRRNRDWRALRRFGLGGDAFRLLAAGAGYWLRAELDTLLRRARRGFRPPPELPESSC